MENADRHRKLAVRTCGFGGCRAGATAFQQHIDLMMIS
jgi:hypothetical protein